MKTIEEFCRGLGTLPSNHPSRPHIVALYRQGRVIEAAAELESALAVVVFLPQWCRPENPEA